MDAPNTLTLALSKYRTSYHPNKILFLELASGKRPRGDPRRCFKDQLNIDRVSWRNGSRTMNRLEKSSQRKERKILIEKTPEDK